MTNRRSAQTALLWLLITGCMAAPGAWCDAGVLQYQARFKAFGSLAALPERDVGRLADGTPSAAFSSDLRNMLTYDKALGSGRSSERSMRLVVHHALVSHTADAPASGTGINPMATDDGVRVGQLSWTLDEGNRHQWLHRIERLAVQLQGAQWSMTLGRDAVSLGSGMVFQPLDLFNPFTPTAVDRDYKAGDDLLRLGRRFGESGNAELLVVARRERRGNGLSADTGAGAPSWAAGSQALRVQTLVGETELDLFTGRHLRDRVSAVSLRLPLGGALLRTDVLHTRLHEGGSVFSGLVNMDYSFMLGSRNVYAFAEYFYNGFGVSRLPQTLTQLPEPLTDRLLRGELFTLMRNYVAAGVNVDWHPLVQPAATVISNLHDGSTLLQLQVRFDLSDSQRLDAGLVHALGSRGEEFAGVGIVPGAAVTTGGGSQVYARWVWYF